MKMVKMDSMQVCPCTIPVCRQSLLGILPPSAHYPPAIFNNHQHGNKPYYSLSSNIRNREITSSPSSSPPHCMIIAFEPPTTTKRKYTSAEQTTASPSTGVVFVGLRTRTLATLLVFAATPVSRTSQPDRTRTACVVVAVVEFEESVAGALASWAVSHSAFLAWLNTNRCPCHSRSGRSVGVGSCIYRRKMKRKA